MQPLTLDRKGGKMVSKGKMHTIPRVIDSSKLTICMIYYPASFIPDDLVLRHGVYWRVQLPLHRRLFNTRADAARFRYEMSKLYGW